MKYSPSTGCFYPDDLDYASPPADLVETTDVVFQAWCASPSGSSITIGTDGSLTIQPPAGPTLAQAQAAQIAVLHAAYKAAADAPASFTTAAGTGASFPQSTEAKTYLAQCIDAGSGAWSLNLWLDVDNVAVAPFTYADLQGLAAAMEAVEVPAYRDLLAKVADVSAATTIEAVQAITF